MQSWIEILRSQRSFGCCGGDVKKRMTTQNRQKSIKRQKN